MLFSVWVKTDEAYFNKPKLLRDSLPTRTSEVLTPFVGTEAGIRLDDPNSLDILIELGRKEIINMNLKAIAEELKFELAGEAPDPDTVFAVDDALLRAGINEGWQIICVYKNTAIYRITLTIRDMSFYAHNLDLAERIFSYEDPGALETLIRLAKDLTLISKEEIGTWWPKVSGVGPAILADKIRRRLLKTWRPWGLRFPPSEEVPVPF